MRKIIFRLMSPKDCLLEEKNQRETEEEEQKRDK